MGSPAGRVLALLERVQERPGLTARELAEGLGVSERTVRRYVATLQELGIPVEASRGSQGGHRLRPGFRMPPLMLSTDEAVAITLALAVVNGAQEGDTTPAEAALRKLLRALPRETAQRVEEVLAAVTAPGRGPFVAGVPDPGRLAALASGVVGHRVCRIRHRDGRGGVTVREVNPYGVVVVRGHTYLHAWCHLRSARRTFRIDRLDRVDLLAKTFRAPADLDVADAVQRSLALAWTEHAVSVLLHAPLDEVEPYFPRHLALCERVDAVTTRLRLSTRNLDATVLRISDHPFTMTVEEPPELRTAFARTAERLAVAARPTGAPQERTTG
ncbi:MAG: YafY family protein [Nocardioides sp.]